MPQLKLKGVPQAHVLRLSPGRPHPRAVTSVEYFLSKPKPRGCVHPPPASVLLLDRPRPVFLCLLYVHVHHSSVTQRREGSVRPAVAPLPRESSPRSATAPNSADTCCRGTLLLPWLLQHSSTSAAVPRRSSGRRHCYLWHESASYSIVQQLEQRRDVRGCLGKALLSPWRCRYTQGAAHCGEGTDSFFPCFT